MFFQIVALSRLIKLRIGRMRTAIDNHFAVRREKRTTIVAKFIGQTLDVFAVGVHRIKLQIAISF